MPGFQVTGKNGGGNTGIRQQTMSTQKSLFLFPFTTFLSAIPDFPFSYFLKREVYFGSKFENDGNGCWWGFGISVNYFHAALSCCLSFCCCNITARALFVPIFKKYPISCLYFQLPTSGSLSIGKKVWKCFLPDTCAGIQTHIMSVKFQMNILLADPSVHGSPQGTAGISFGHQICLL